jgi:hypothetical protein
MKIRTLLWGMVLGTFMACSQSDTIEEEETPKEDIDVTLFAQDDGSQALPTNPLTRFNTLFKAIDPVKMAKGLNGLTISEQEYQEIKAFVMSDIVKSETDPQKIYNGIFNWVSNHIKYNDTFDPFFSNDAYAVFKNRKAVCQGYTNLLKVMLHSQSIPVVSIGGLLRNGGSDVGHAWNYVYVNGSWRMADATNKVEFPIDNTASYSNWRPSNADIDLFENESIVCNYQDGHLNVRRVKSQAKKWSFPFGISGYRITSFNPNQNLPNEIEEVYLSKNVATLGESLIGLATWENRLKRIYVDASNQQLSEKHGIVYWRYSDQQHNAEIPYVIPSQMDTITLKPIRYMGKGTLTNHQKVKVLILSQGTQAIEAYAIENCPSLRKVHIPNSVKEIDKDAFYQMEDIEIIH